jgi:hypothetical protein
MSTRDQWELPSHEHTFSSGRTARLRTTLSIREVSRRAVEMGENDVADAIVLMANGELKDPLQAMRIEDAIVRSMFVHPRIGSPDDPDSTLTLRAALSEIVSEGDIDEAHAQAQAALDAQAVPLTALSDDEIAETLTEALRGVSEAQRFRDERDGQAGGGDSPGVADDPVPVPGDGAGEPGGADPGPGPGEARTFADTDPEPADVSGA